MRIPIKVPYQGKDHEVILEDDIPFGEVKGILSKLTKQMFDEGNAGQQVNAMIDLSQEMMEKVVKDAPWTLTDGWSNNIGIKTNKVLIEEISKLYPLDELFTGMMSTIAGDSQLTSSSMHNAPKISTGHQDK